MLVKDGMHERIARAQREDPLLHVIFKMLETTEYEDYLACNDVLCKVIREVRKVVIPKGMQDIIGAAHKLGHFGVKKTMEMLQRQHWFHDMKRRIERFIHNYVPCILGNRKMGKLEGLLNAIPKGDVPMDTIHLDHIGSLENPFKKFYKHILVLVDRFSKFIWLFPIKTITTREVIEKLKIHQQNFGNPRRFVSDRGTAFTSEEFGSYCEDEGILHQTIAAGVPRGNGQVERLNNVY